MTSKSEALKLRSDRTFVPQCCRANKRNAFVVTLKYRIDSGEIWGESWVTRVVDSNGLIHDVKTENCPACGANLSGLDSEELKKRGK